MGVLTGYIEPIVFFKTLKTSLITPFFQGIPIFQKENELISLVKMKIPWKIKVSKLALKLLYSLGFSKKIFDLARYKNFTESI
jgi:hypothetical protein